MTLDSIEKVEASFVLGGIALLVSGALLENPKFLIVSMAAVLWATVLRLSRWRRKDAASVRLSSNDPDGGGDEKPHDSIAAQSLTKRPIESVHSEQPVSLKKNA